LATVEATSQDWGDRLLGHDWVLLLVGALFLFSAQRAIATGKTSLGLATVRRSDNEVLFWFGVLVSVMVGAVVIAIAFSRWYHRIFGR
jgi:hypothetical protein